MAIIRRFSIMKYAILDKNEMKEEYYSNKCECFYSAIGSPCGQYVPARFEDEDAPEDVAYTTEELFMDKLREWGYIE